MPPKLCQQRVECIVESYLVIQVVEVAAVQVVAIFVGIIDFGDEEQMGILFFYLWDGPSPEFDGHHLRHVAAEAVYVFRGPKEEDVPHLFPRVGDRVEVAGATVLVVYAVVQFHCLVPIVNRRASIEAVVARSFGGIFMIGFSSTALHVELPVELALRDVVEVVVGAKGIMWIVVGTKL